MALQHLRSSTANKRPTPGGMSDGQLALNTNVASPGLFFKDSTGALVKAGPVHVGSTAPNASPAVGGQAGNSTGELWLDTSLTPNELKTWNGSAWVSATGQEIPVSKLIDGSARQLLQTDAAGTGVEWTSNVDVPGTLDVTSTATFDSIASHPLGSAGAPTITFTGDTNTGIYSPGADQLALSTNGNGRLFIDSSGRVGVGTSSPRFALSIGSTSGVGTATPDTIDLGASYSSTFGANPKLRLFWDGTTAYGLGVSAVATSQLDYIVPTGSDHVWYIGGTERMRINPSGAVGIGTGSPGVKFDVVGTNVVSAFKSTNNQYVTQLQGNDATYKVYLGTTNANDFLIANESNNGTFAERLRITSAGNVGIGTTTPNVTGFGSTVTTINVAAGNNGGLELTKNNVAAGHFTVESAASNDIRVGAVGGSAALTFQTAGNERGRFDSSGRLLIGTSSALTNVARYGSDTTPANQFRTNSTSNWDTGLSLINYSASGYAPVLTFGLSGSNTAGTNSIVANGDRLGVITFNGNDATNFEEAARIEAFVDGTPGANDMPGRLVFSTTADGASSPTERLRIGATGAIGLSGANYGTSGQVLTSAGPGAPPTWATAAAGGGKILQVVQASYSTAVTYTSTTTWTSSGLSASITPSSSSSKVLVMISASVGNSRTTDGATGNGFKIERSGTAILTTPNEYGMFLQTYAYSSYMGHGLWVPLHILDSPATTSSITYTLYGKNYVASGTSSFQGGTNPSTITLMEVAA